MQVQRQRSPSPTQEYSTTPDEAKVTKRFIQERKKSLSKKIDAFLLEEFNPYFQKNQNEENLSQIEQNLFKLKSQLESESNCDRQTLDSIEPRFLEMKNDFLKSKLTRRFESIMANEKPTSVQPESQTAPLPITDPAAPASKKMSISEWFDAENEQMEFSEFFTAEKSIREQKEELTKEIANFSLEEIQCTFDRIKNDSSLQTFQKELCDEFSKKGLELISLYEEIVEKKSFIASELKNVDSKFQTLKTEIEGILNQLFPKTAPIAYPLPSATSFNFYPTPLVQPAAKTDDDSTLITHPAVETDDQNKHLPNESRDKSSDTQETCFDRKNLNAKKIQIKSEIKNDKPTKTTETLESTKTSFAQKLKLSEKCLSDNAEHAVKIIENIQKLVNLKEITIENFEQNVLITKILNELKSTTAFSFLENSNDQEIKDFLLHLVIAATHQNRIWSPFSRVGINFKTDTINKIIAKIKSQYTSGKWDKKLYYKGQINEQGKPFGYGIFTDCDDNGKNAFGKDNRVNCYYKLEGFWENGILKEGEIEFKDYAFSGSFFKKNDIIQGARIEKTYTHNNIETETVHEGTFYNDSSLINMGLYGNGKITRKRRDPNTKVLKTVIEEGTFNKGTLVTGKKTSLEDTLSTGAKTTYYIVGMNDGMTSKLTLPDGTTFTPHDVRMPDGTIKKSLPIEIVYDDACTISYCVCSVGTKTKPDGVTETGSFYTHYGTGPLGWTGPKGNLHQGTRTKTNGEEEIGTFDELGRITCGKRIFSKDHDKYTEYKGNWQYSSEYTGNGKEGYKTGTFTCKDGSLKSIVDGEFVTPTKPLKQE